MEFQNWLGACEAPHMSEFVEATNAVFLKSSWRSQNGQSHPKVFDKRQPLCPECHARLVTWILPREQMTLTSVHHVQLSVSYILYYFYERVGESLPKKLNQFKKVCGFYLQNYKRLGPWTWGKKSAVTFQEAFGNREK